MLFRSIASAQAIRIHSFIKELKKDYELEVLCGEEKRKDSDRLKEVRYYTLQRPQEKEPLKFIQYFIKFNRKILSITKKRKYDLVIITIPRYEFLYAINRLEAPYILDIRDLLTTKNYELILQRFLPKTLARAIANMFEKKKKKSIKKAIRRSKMTTVAYPGLYNYYTKTIPKQKQKIIFIPNGVDLEYFPKKEKKFNTEKIQILYIGNFHEKDLLKEMIQALAPIKEKIELTLVGTGREKEHIGRILKEKGMIAKIPGKLHHEEIAKIGETADIGIILRDKTLPTLLPVSLVEYMAMQLPVIVNNYSELGDFVQQTQAGYIIEDPSELQALLENINRKEFPKIGKRNREWIEKFGDRNKIAKDFKENIVSKSI